MTKRKAIKAAIDWAWAQADNPDRKLSISALSANRAYEAGRIAGLREAARILPSGGTIYGWVEKDKLRQRANALAKKARISK